MTTPSYTADGSYDLTTPEKRLAAAEAMLRNIAIIPQAYHDRGPGFCRDEMARLAALGGRQLAAAVQPTGPLVGRQLAAAVQPTGPLVGLLQRAIPLLVRLGDYAGNAEGRCELLGDAHEALSAIGADVPNAYPAPKNTCRYSDCVNAATNNVCKHDTNQACDCDITCGRCRAYMGLPSLSEVQS